MYEVVLLDNYKHADRFNSLFPDMQIQYSQFRRDRYHYLKLYSQLQELYYDCCSL